MAATRARVSSFSANVSTVRPNETMFISSGIPDLDKILGGGFSLGSLVMVMEDPEAPHHMLLLRNFMSQGQGLLQKQPLLYDSASRNPKSFLGTLPSPTSPKGDKSSDIIHEKDLRIAWQYKKYFGEPQLILNTNNSGQHDYSNDFDLRKPLDRQFLVAIMQTVLASMILLTLLLFKIVVLDFLLNSQGAVIYNTSLEMYS